MAPLALLALVLGIAGTGSTVHFIRDTRAYGDTTSFMGLSFSLMVLTVAACCAVPPIVTATS